MIHLQDVHEHGPTLYQYLRDTGIATLYLCGLFYGCLTFHTFKRKHLR